MTPKKTIKKENEISFDFQKLMRDSDSYKSLIYGIVTVIVLFIVIALGVRTLQQNKAMVDEEALSTKSTESQKLSKNQHVVIEGETLWSIAESEYGDGFQWTEIAKVNNITDAQALEKGTKLIIPNSKKVMEAAIPTEVPANDSVQANTISPTAIPQKMEVKEYQPEMTSAQSIQKITGNVYNIVEGDTLWDIAVRAYGDGYRWSEIAASNSIVNPNLIYTGNSLNIPRP